jgi:hypothetical protein
MHKIAILLKTHIRDIKWAERAVLSYMKHNIDKIPLYIVVPDSDLRAFEGFTGEAIELHSDESVTTNLAYHNSVSGFAPGYINQEVIKLAFWEKRYCENYLCMDSDGVFIRDFYVSDFMYDDDTPFTILVEDNELIVEPEYYNLHWRGRERAIRLIQKAIGLDDKRMLTCHNFAILSCKVLESLYRKYLLPKNLTYRDLISQSPYEFSWYNMWLQKDKTIKIEFREPIFKMFHHKNHHLEYLRKGITLQDISRGYIGVVLNSGYSREYGVVSYEDGDVYDLSVAEIGCLFRRVPVSVFHVARKELRRVLSRVKARALGR